jgi:ribulose-5-phosphate 4-epimerase/fuculose-1-phosphate aldolase
MPTDADVMRRDIVTVCQRLYQRGFIAGTEGNVSAITDQDRLWITPSGHHKGCLQPSDLLLIDLDGLENHGSIAVGASLQAAFNNMEIVERAAQILYLAKLLGHVHPLPPEAVAALQALR